MKIGKVELENNVFLAPMAGVTDLSFRIICRKMGAGMVYSEMVSAKGIFYNNKNTSKMLIGDISERPLALQLFGSNPQIMADIAKKLCENTDIQFDIIDINMGCPAPKIFKNGEGSALLKNPALIGEIVKAVSSAANVPVTAKIRTGIDSDSINAIEVAKIIEQNGGAAVTLHGRTRVQQYSGIADWDIIRQVKQAVKIPVIGNGDVTSPEAAKKMLNETGCDGIMIGRAAEGNPWIFKRTVHYLQTGKLLPEPSIEEKISLALFHAEMTIAEKGEFTGVMEMRKHLCWYIKGIPGAADARSCINTAQNIDEIKSVLNIS